MTRNSNREIKLISVSQNDGENPGYIVQRPVPDDVRASGGIQFTSTITVSAKGSTVKNLLVKPAL